VGACLNFPVFPKITRSWISGSDRRTGPGGEQWPLVMDIPHRDSNPNCDFGTFYSDRRKPAARRSRAKLLISQLHYAKDRATQGMDRSHESRLDGRVSNLFVCFEAKTPLLRISSRCRGPPQRLTLERPREPLAKQQNFSPFPPVVSLVWSAP